MATASLFADLCRQFNAQPDRRGEVHIVCPRCRKEPARGQTHASFSERGFHCFVCSASMSLAELSGSPRPVNYQPVRPEPKPKRAASWKWDADAIVARACAAPDRVTLWRAYRPLSLESMSFWQLGVEVVPACRCPHRRLLFPIRKDGRIVGLAGRQIECPPDCEHAGTKLVVASGGETVLFNGSALRPGAEVVVTENRVDAVLAGQHWPEIVAVAAGSTSYWRMFVDQIAASRPAKVCVWFDNDPTGCPNTETYAAHVRDFIAKGKAPVEPSGIQMVNALRAKGVKAEPWPWPSGTPAKHDPGAFITDLLLKRRVA